jgi:hypothetical protein
MDQALKVRENRARRAAIRQGFELQKSPRRDKNALDYGRYMLFDAASEAPVFGHDPRPFSATLEEIETRLRIV